MFVNGANSLLSLYIRAVSSDLAGTLRCTCLGSPVAPQRPLGAARLAHDLLLVIDQRARLTLPGCAATSGSRAGTLAASGAAATAASAAGHGRLIQPHSTKLGRQAQLDISTDSR